MTPAEDAYMEVVDMQSNVIEMLRDMKNEALTAMMAYHQGVAEIWGDLDGDLKERYTEAYNETLERLG